MARLLGVLLAGCCCAALAACATTSAPATPAERHPEASLPRPARAWNEDFASGIKLETITVDGDDVLVPEGVRIPIDTQVSASTEAMLVMADDDPAAIQDSITRSCAKTAYKPYAKSDTVTVWVGNGMAVRLETTKNVQILAWGPEALKDEFTPGV